MTEAREAFKGGKAFIPFITVGDPDLEFSKALIPALAEAGADLIELGIPFSDPTAEGVVIQAANERALLNKVTTDDVFDLVEEIRGEVKIPLAIMTYANVVFTYGIERFCLRMVKSDISSLILPDVPFEEKEEFASLARKHGISIVSLIAPTSDERIRMIAKEAEGFLYCVSSLGVTGVRSNITTDIGSMVKKVREANSSIPVAVGFGISTPEQAKRMASLSDGAIVGSAIVSMIARDGKSSLDGIRSYVKEMKRAVRS